MALRLSMRIHFRMSRRAEIRIITFEWVSDVPQLTAAGILIPCFIKIYVVNATSTQ